MEISNITKAPGGATDQDLIRLIDSLAPAGDFIFAAMCMLSDSGIDRCYADGLRAVLNEAEKSIEAVHDELRRLHGEDVAGETRS